MRSTEPCRNILARAINSGDLNQWLGTLTDDAVFLPPDHPMVTGKRAVRPWVKKAFFDPFKMRFKQAFDEIESFGATAIGRGRFTLSLTPGPAAGRPECEASSLTSSAASLTALGNSPASCGTLTSRHRAANLDTGNKSFANNPFESLVSWCNPFAWRVTSENCVTIPLPVTFYVARYAPLPRGGENGTIDWFPLGSKLGETGS
jgi:ketosteroid isomerase-like protein